MTQQNNQTEINASDYSNPSLLVNKRNDDKHNMFVWIYSALLNRSFGGQSDSTIDACIDVLKKNSIPFPAENLNRKIREKNRITEITEGILESDEAVILNLFHQSNCAGLTKLKNNSLKISRMVRILH